MFAFEAADKHFSGVCPEGPTSLVSPAPSSIGLLDSHGNNEDTKTLAAEELQNKQEALDYSTVNGNGTPPINIVMTTSQSRSRSRAKENNVAEQSAEAISRPAHLTQKANRRRKRGPKKPAVATLTVHGFTPATSGDEGSDSSTGYSRGRKNLPRQRTSILRKDFLLDANRHDNRSSSPGSPGISALTQQLDSSSVLSGSECPPMDRSKSKLTLGPSSSETNSDGEEATDTTCYEVNLEHDYINPDIPDKKKRDARQDPLFNGGVVRKMQATDFEPLRCLGKGTYGTVLLVKQAVTGRLYAQKQFRKASLTVRKQLVEQTKTERAILESINRHPFLVKLYYAFQDHEKLYLILEYAEGGELFSLMQTERMFPEETAAFYMAEMALALEHLHRVVGVVYRDLKPENCLLDSEGHLLLTDFGLSKVSLDDDPCRSMTGTLEYMAPEVIQMQKYGTAVDWWSFGVFGFDMLTGSSPFHDQNCKKIQEKIIKCKLVLPFYLSPDAKDLLTRLLRKEPKKRLGASMPKDMLAIKKHRFFRKIDWRRLEMREMEPPIRPLITDPELAENFSSEFTNLPLSPTVPSPLDQAVKGEHDPFGGFSFVGSRSLLQSANGFL